MNFQSVRHYIADFIYPEGRQRRNLLERISNTCHLTGLANRRAFDLMRTAIEANETLAVIVFDLNNFKRVNDELGHTRGDAVLIEFAARLKKLAPRYGYPTLIRLGGDEFVVVIENIHADNFRNAVENERIMAGRLIVTVSGTIGKTFEDADKQLNTRKMAHKAEVAARQNGRVQTANFQLKIA